MKLSDFTYSFPEELVAQKPLDKRDSSRMLVINRKTRDLNDNLVKTLPDFLKKGDLIVINDSKVIPCRLFGEKETGSKIEVLLLEEIQKNQWKVIVNRKKRIKTGQKITFSDNLHAKVVENSPKQVIIDLISDIDILSEIQKIGVPPLPPYIKRREISDYSKDDINRYQTVYAKNIGSAAAPTAGFHLSDNLMKKCRDKGVDIASVTLHVGIDTFSPVRVANLSDHKMHGERYIIDSVAADKINQAKKEGRRIIAIGTTTVRVLESEGKRLNKGHVEACKAGEIRNTHLFITPGFHFQITDAILTNFHQPCSTLLMLVSAFAGKEFILQMYEEAIKRRFRLFSYGDCMLII